MIITYTRKQVAMGKDKLHKEKVLWVSGQLKQKSARLMRFFWRQDHDIGECRALRTKKRIESLNKTDFNQE